MTYCDDNFPSSVLYLHKIHYMASTQLFSQLSIMFQVEKYRPQLVKDIVGNAEAVGRLQVIAEEGNLPNVILSVSLDRPHNVTRPSEQSFL